MTFEFATANRILFGPGISAEIPALARTLGNSVLILTDSKIRARLLIKGLSKIKISSFILKVEKEPDINLVIMAMRMYNEYNCNFVIALGGGSSIDTGKALASLVANPGNPLDYLEIVGSGRIFEKPSVPFIAVPTTSGTGSEVTRNAVIAIPEHHIKVSLRSPFLLPKVAVIDPELTYSLPPALTASTGLDALTQLIEPFICNSPTPLTDLVCRSGIVLASKSLLQAYHNGYDIKAREEMSLVSLYGGMALANARLGAVHGLASCLGGIYPMSHGLICARLLPLVMETNLRSLRSRQPESPILKRFAEIAQLLTGNPVSSAEDAIVFLFDLQEKLEIPKLREFGLESKDFSYLVAQAQKSSSMRGNPIKLTDEDLITILEKAI
jgi:alcohol dehydrogenase class IV